MLRKYQEKYKKQKEESLMHSSPLLGLAGFTIDNSSLPIQIDESSLDSSNEYVNRSFVSGTQKAVHYPTPTDATRIVSSN